MNPSRARWAVAVAAVALLACQEAELVLQETGQRWSKAVFTHDENQQWFLHPVSDARPPLVFIDFVFSEIRVGTNPKISISALDWKQVDPPRAHP
ncbi:MAG: hypothetical protein O3A20_05580 [Planctomycetota bacterium]|nr:hypothetical protein [Planctomycetota bacterium]